MTTIYQRLRRASSAYSGPQTRFVSQNEIEPIPRRQSQQSELFAAELERRRRSSAVSEQISVINSVESLKAGKLPTNNQINNIIDRLVISVAAQNSMDSLSKDGHLLIQDFHQLLLAVQHALQTKNRDELFQSLVYHVRRSRISSATSKRSIKTGNKPSEETKHDCRAVYKLSKLLLFNSKFRALLVDILLVTQQILGFVAETSGSETETMHQEADSHVIDNAKGISAEEIMMRVKETVMQLQQNKEFQKAISTILSIFRLWSKRTNDHSFNERRDSMGNDNFTFTAIQEAKIILQDWVNRKSLDPIIEKSQELACEINGDPELSQLYDEISTYIEGCLGKPDYLKSAQSTEEESKLIDKVRKSDIEKYKPEISSLLQDSINFITSINEDETTKNISKRIKAIHNHLWYDSWGNTTFKPQLLNDLRVTLIPALLDQIKYVPLPQIAYSDKKYDIVLENMVIPGDTIIPETFEIKVDDLLKFSPNKNESYKSSQSMYVHMDGIQTVLEDVVFYYKRKTGFPRLTDAGVVSIHTGGEGIRLSLKVSSAVDQFHFFRMEQCHCHIDKLVINVKDSKHKMLYKMFNPMLTGVIKRQITKSIETMITSMFEQGEKKITRQLIQKKHEYDEDKADSLKDGGRSGLLSHIVNTLNQRVTSI